MPEDPDYAPAIPLTPGRIIASLLVVVWIAVVFQIGGLLLGVRAMLLFLFPLTFIWIPEWMARIAGRASRKSLAADVLVNPAVLRWIGWFLIVGVPVSWLLMAQAAAA